VYHCPVYALSLVIGYDAKQYAKCLPVRSPETMPQKLKLSEKIQFTIHMFEDLVDLGERQEKSDRFAFVKSEVEQPAVHNRLHLFYDEFCLRQIHLRHIAPARPGLVIDLHDIMWQLGHLIL